MSIASKIFQKLAGIPQTIVRLRDNWRFISTHKHLRKQKKLVYALTPTPYLKNVGDQAQAIAIHAWLKKHFPELPVLEVNKEECRYLLPALKWLIQPSDVLFLHSGGNLGDRGIWSESVRRLIITDFRKNQIISLPQTIYFSDTEKGRKEQSNSSRIYASHPQLTVIGRDPQSGKLAGELFPKAQTFCMPDFVLSMPTRKVKPQSQPPKVLLCLRLDDESALSAEQRAKIGKELPYEHSYFDTTLADPIAQGEREKILEETLELFDNADAVVTDRYHGLIFAILCKKPCVVLPTVDHKLTSAMFWFKDVPFVAFAEGLNEINSLIEQCLKIEDREAPDWNSLYFDQLPKLVNLQSQKSK